MWSIDELSLTLPAGFEGRADRIARLVGEALSELPASGDLALERLALPPLTVDPVLPDREVAGRIARSIAHGVEAAAAPAPARS